MTREDSRMPAQGMQGPIDAGPAPPSDDRFSRGLRGFGPLGILAILVIAVGTLVNQLVGAVLVLGWAWRSHTPWRESGYVSPKSWIGSATFGLAFGGAFKLLMKAIVMPML